MNCNLTAGIKSVYLTMSKRGSGYIRHKTTHRKADVSEIICQIALCYIIRPKNAIIIALFGRIIEYCISVGFCMSAIEEQAERGVKSQIDSQNKIRQIWISQK